jgi:hypothetical protein
MVRTASIKAVAVADVAAQGSSSCNNSWQRGSSGGDRNGSEVVIAVVTAAVVIIAGATAVHAGAATVARVVNGYNRSGEQ